MLTVQIIGTNLGLVQNVKFCSEKLFLVWSKTFWTCLNHFEPIEGKRIGVQKPRILNSQNNYTYNIYIYLEILFSKFNLPKIKALAFAMDINEALKSEQDQIAESLGKLF